MKFLILFALLPILIQAEYKKLEWSDCGSKQVDIYTVDVQPMPIIQPGTIYLTFRANIKRDLDNELKTDLKIVRSVAGVSLPIRCYTAMGLQVGSCSYKDLCPVIEQLLPNNFNPSVCLPELAQYGIDCTCPLKLKKGPIEINNVDLVIPEAGSTAFSFLASGDFDITLNTSDNKGPYGCVNIKFTVKPKKN